MNSCLGFTRVNTCLPCDIDSLMTKMGGSNRSITTQGSVEKSIQVSGDYNIIINNNVNYTTYVNGKEKTVSFHVPDPLPDVKTFFGREKEIEDLYGMIHERRHKVIAITGQGGIGKSALLVKLLEELAKRNESFEAISWQSLRYKPTFDLTIDDLIISLSKKITQEDIGRTDAEQKINLLIQLLAQKR